MNATVSSTPTPNHQHRVRNEQGQFAKHTPTSSARLCQDAADANVNNWRWLSQHGYARVAPSDIFLGALDN